MSEFLNRLCIVDNLTFIDEDRRLLFLLQASDFKRFSHLNIERNFFTFTKNSSYIFRFFEELAGEKIELDKLLGIDVYAEYEEHLLILKELRQNYIALTLENNMCDTFLVPAMYRLNHDYLTTAESITIHVDGYLTNFELELLESASKEVDLSLIIQTSAFNTKMIHKLFAYGFYLEENREYQLDFRAKKIISDEPLPPFAKVEATALSQDFLQVAFIKYKIDEFVRRGYDINRIAVILPNEAMSEELHLFDTKGNLNIAKGFSFRHTRLYRRIEATLLALDNPTEENRHRLNRVGRDLYELISPIYFLDISKSGLFNTLQAFAQEDATKQEYEIILKHIERMRRLEKHLEGMNAKAVLTLLMQRLREESIDDVRGGKVTVMGLLETRGVQFDAIIIPDFNDEYVPRRSDKDMFLNTTIREFAELPTTQDRERLQLHYYHMIMHNAKEVAISFVKSQESLPSRFLKQLGIPIEQNFDETYLREILFKEGKYIKREQEEILLEHDFSRVIFSASLLKTLLQCKRRYYYRYIAKLESHEIPKDIAKEYEIGDTLHKALQNLYQDSAVFTSVESLKRAFEQELTQLTKDSAFDRYQLELYKQRFESFYQNEIDHFHEGWHVKMVERSLTGEFCGVKISGRIDRIDERDSELFVLDYKSGSYPEYTLKNYHEADDFQLEFYYLLASKLGRVAKCGYYDLGSGKIAVSNMIEPKLELLQKHINEFLAQKEVNFQMCDDLGKCRFCDYKTLCGRG